MRNLKRTLSLVLAALMLMSMMVVGAGAATKDFTDSDEIQHKEAVEVMVALNVVSGKDDGSYFAPTDTFTREEMAKVVSYVMNGGVEPVVGTKVTPTYSDIKGIWSEKYIEYCTSMGIISGDGAGKFNPTGTLTAEQAAKMFLTAMGYDAKVFGFVGNDWAINVGRYANEAGLYKDLGNVVPSQPITRDDAMQMAYNAIQGTMMKRTWSQDITTGQLTESYVPWIDDNIYINGVVHTIPHTLLADKFDGSIVMGYMTGFSYDDTKAQWSYTFDSSAKFGGNAINTQNAVFANATTLKSTVDYTDLFGQQVKVIYNIKKDNVVYGVYANDSSVIVSGATGNIEDYSTTANTVTVAGTDYKLSDHATKISVYDYNNVYATKDDTDILTLAELKPTTDGDNLTAYTFKLVDNTGDGKIDAVIRTPMTIAKINYVGKDSVQLGSGIGAVKYDELVTYDGYAAGDWVCYIKAANAVLGENTIQKIDLQTAAVSGVRGGAGANTYTEYQINGQWLAASNGTAFGNTTYTNMIEKADVNDTVEYVALGSTIFYAKIVDIAATSKNIAMIVTAGIETSNNTNVTGSTLKAKLLFADGSTSVVTVSKLDGTPVDAKNPGNLMNEIASLVTYRLDGSNYELTTVSDTNKAGYKNYVASDAPAPNNNQSGYVDGKVNGFELADDAVVYFFGSAIGANASNKADIYTGKEIKNTWGSATKGDNKAKVQVLTQEINGFTYAKVVLLIDAANGLPTVTTGSNYGYLAAPTYRSVEEDGKTYLNYTIHTANGVLNVKEENTAAPKDYPQGSVVTFDVVSDGVVKNVNLPHVKTGMVTGWDGSSKISLDNKVSEIDAKDTTVLYVDSDKMVGVEGGSIQKAADTDGNGTPDLKNVRYVLSANYVVLLVVDINNEMEADPAINVIGPALDNASTADIQNALSKSIDAYKNLEYTEVTVNVPAEGMTVGALTVPKGMTLTFTGAGTVTMTGDWTVVDTDSSITVDGTLDLNSWNLLGSGSVTAENGTLHSGIAGTVKVTFKNAELKGAFTVSGGTLTVNGAITSDGSYTIAISGDSVVKVTGDVAAALNISGSASVDAGTITGNVTSTGSASVKADSITGNVTTDSTGAVSVTGTITGNVTATGDGRVDAGKVDGTTSGNVYQISPDATSYIVKR